MAKYKIGDIFINHNDGKILQVCEGDSCIDCCYNKARLKTCLGGVSCLSLIGVSTCFKELPSLPPGTKVKVREDLKEGARYGRYTFVGSMEQNKEVAIRDYDASHEAYVVVENIFSYTLEMFDQVINNPKENNNMETKEIKIKVPEGYEIDKENSTCKCIKLKPIKKELTYEDVAEELFPENLFTLNISGGISYISSSGSQFDKNNATSKKQLERLLALNQLFNIAEYYNKKSPKKGNRVYCINLDERSHEYYFQDYISPTIIRGLIPTFNNEKDAKAVIDSPNFKEILDLIYKCDED